jgi:exosortase B
MASHAPSPSYPAAILDFKNFALWSVLAGLAAMYVPTFANLASGLWSTEANAHGPIVLVVVLFLLWRLRGKLALGASLAASVIGGAALLSGLLLYVVGRSQGFPLFETASLLPVLIGTLLLLGGWKAVTVFWFPILFLAFLIPLPPFLVELMTGALKTKVSVIVDAVLYAAGYPVARDGVTLSIGPYQLLVADACSGLHSMFSLSAMGLLYLYLVEHKSAWRNSLLIAAILPIAFVANIVRVIILVLVTYYLGDAAGQGFVHGFAGITLFVIALLFLFAFDLLLGLFLKGRP